jgi:hypothetical protein
MNLLQRLNTVASKLNMSADELLDTFISTIELRFATPVSNSNATRQVKRRPSRKRWSAASRAHMSQVKRDWWAQKKSAKPRIGRPKGIPMTEEHRRNISKGMRVAHMRKRLAKQMSAA